MAEIGRRTTVERVEAVRRRLAQSTWLPGLGALALAGLLLLHFVSSAGTPARAGVDTVRERDGAWMPAERATTARLERRGLPARAQKLAPGCYSWIGMAQGVPYAAVSVDSRLRAVDLQVNGSPGQWMSGLRPLDRAATGSEVAVLSGTFWATGADAQPLGNLVWDEGQRSWTPTTVRRRERGPQAGTRPVYRLPRWCVAVLANGRAIVEDSGGDPVTAVRARLEKRYGSRVRTLLGGGGPLLKGGAVAITPAALERAGFDEISGVEAHHACPRTAVGVDAQDRLVLVACAAPLRRGITLRRLALLARDCGATSAIFLDAGHCADLILRKQGDHARRPLETRGLPQPVVMVVR